MSTPGVRSQRAAHSRRSAPDERARQSSRSVQGRAGEPVPGQVVVDPGDEGRPAGPRHQLAQHGRALGVGDVVVGGPCGIGVGHLPRPGRDRVGGGSLVGVVAAGLAGQREVGPGAGEGGGLRQHLEAHVGGERLAQPDVVPPGHGDQVTEPHVGHLVRDDHPAGLPFGLGDRGREQELVAEGDAARVLHRSGLELGDERLVVGVEGVRLGEDLQVAVEAGPGDGEDLRCVPVQRPASDRLLCRPNGMPRCSPRTLW